MKEYIKLFFTFAKIGLFTFGGGYAMLPLLQRELVEKNKWAEDEELMDYFAIGQCTPGIIAVNTATFVGYKRKGIAGGIFATLGLVFPSLVIIMIIAAFLKSFADLTVVGHALRGINAGVCALIFDAVIKLTGKSVIDRYTLIIFLLVFFVSLLTGFSTILLVILSGLAGYIVCKIRAKLSNGGENS